MSSSSLTDQAYGYASALDDFRRARHQADMELVVARLTGRSAELLSFEEVRRKLGAKADSTQELAEIPLDAIVGSVGRYADFTRSFLPRHDSDAERWARVEMVVTDLRGMPPISVYQVGQVYFVDDGHHRVSVARQLGARTIQAYVTPVRTKAPLSPGDQPDDLILKAEQAGFLERTHLDEQRPGADLRVTVPRQYAVLEEEIELLQYTLGLNQQQGVPFSEAAARWYDELYLPAVRLIRQRGMLRDFPKRTETDLYVWISRHRAALEQEWGWKIAPASAAADLAAHFSPRPSRVAARARQKLLDAVRLDEFKPGPPPGEWRRERLASGDGERLFNEILVPVSGQEPGWQALEQAIEIARREGGRLHGLNVVALEAHLQGKKAQAIQDQFNRRCELAGVSGELGFDVGKVTHKICEWARWVDLVVVNLAFPPARQPVARLKSDFRSLIRLCSRPVLAVPRASYALDRALLAYDGSPKAEEALFIATYLAPQWAVPLVVLCVPEAGRVRAGALEHAQHYLAEHGVQATFVEEKAPVAQAVLKTAQKHKSRLIIMGGYGLRPELGVVLGSTVDHVLRESRQPVLICR